MYTIQSYAWTGQEGPVNAVEVDSVVHHYGDKSSLVAIVNDMLSQDSIAGVIVSRNTSCSVREIHFCKDRHNDRVEKHLIMQRVV